MPATAGGNRPANAYPSPFLTLLFPRADPLTPAPVSGFTAKESWLTRIPKTTEEDDNGPAALCPYLLEIAERARGAAPMAAKVGDVLRRSWWNASPTEAIRTTNTRRDKTDPNRASKKAEVVLARPAPVPGRRGRTHQARRACSSPRQSLAGKVGGVIRD